MFLWRATLGGPRRGVACGEQAAEFGVGVFAEPFLSRNEQPPRPIERVVFAAAVAEGVVLGSTPCLVEAVVGETDHMKRISDLTSLGNATSKLRRYAPRDPKCPKRYRHATPGVAPTAT